MKFTTILLCVVFVSGCSSSARKSKQQAENAKRGAALYANLGCSACHSLDGNVLYGPPLNDIFMKEIKVLRNGKAYTLIVDREYLKKAISEPRYEKVLEFKSKDMPLTSLTDEDVDLLVEYLVALNEENRKNFETKDK